MLGYVGQFDSAPDIAPQVRDSKVAFNRVEISSW